MDPTVAGALIGAGGAVIVAVAGFVANLTGANLTGAYLPRADLSRAVLDGADFTGALWPSNATVPEGWQRDTDSGHLKRADTDADGAATD
jgi:uncharacterized protein YjbI with pentapeptide repeats